MAQEWWDDSPMFSSPIERYRASIRQIWSSLDLDDKIAFMMSIAEMEDLEIN